MPARRRAADRHEARRACTAAPHRRPRHRPVHAALRRPAHRHLRRLRRRQIDAARDARARAGFDTVVVALVGERGREVREFLEDALGDDRGQAPSPSSRPATRAPMMRRLAPHTAMAIAEYFRDRGESRAADRRFGHPLRPCGARRRACGRRAGGGARLSRRASSPICRSCSSAPGPGAKAAGSITGIFSVLVDGDDHNDPVADSIRGTLDGHVVLDRAIADQGRYPAVNVLGSISRLAASRLDAGAARARDAAARA